MNAISCLRPATATEDIQAVFDSGASSEKNRGRVRFSVEVEDIDFDDSGETRPFTESQRVSQQSPHSTFNTNA